MNDKETKETKAPQRFPALPVTDEGEFAVLLDSDRFAQIQRVAALFAQSDLVPDVFKGKPANCAVALQMAFRVRIDPLMLMQSTYVVHGKPGIEAKLAIALMNTRGPFSGPLQWRIEGAVEDRRWTCFATHRDTGERCEATVTWAMVKAEGWDKPRGREGAYQQPSKWTTIPDIMGRYRSAMMLGRLYCPEVLLGLPSREELEDQEPIVVTGERIADASPAQEIVPQPQPIVRERDTQSETVTPSFDLEPQSANHGDDGAAVLDRAIDADQMMEQRIASKPQRDMLGDLARNRADLGPEALDALLVERFGVPLARLPMKKVKESVELIRTLVAGR